MGKIECYNYGPKLSFQTCNIISVCHGASKTVGIQEPTKIGRKGILNDTNKRARFFVAACFWLLYAKWFNITLIPACHVKNDPVNLIQK